MDGAEATKGRPKNMKNMTLTLHTAEGQESPLMRMNPGPGRRPHTKDHLAPYDRLPHRFPHPGPRDPGDPLDLRRHRRVRRRLLGRHRNYGIKVDEAAS